MTPLSFIPGCLADNNPISSLGTVFCQYTHLIYVLFIDLAIKYSQHVKGICILGI